MTTRTLRVVARLISKPDKVEETRAALMALVEKTRAEDGCVVYELMQNDVDPTDFTFVEEWTTSSALEAHLETEHIKDLDSIADDLLASPSDIRRYTLLA